MPKTFSSFSEVKNYLMSVMGDTSCRERAINLADWIFTLGEKNLINPSVKAYLIDDKSDIRFYIRSQGKGHFCVYKLRKSCISLEIYFGVKVRPGFKKYIVPNSSSDKWGIVEKDYFQDSHIGIIHRDIEGAYELRISQ